MGFSSQAGQLLLKRQAVAGTYDSTVGASGIAMRTRSGALNPNRDLIIPDSEIGGVRDIADAYLGAVIWAGEFDFYLRFKEITSLLTGALGSLATVTTTGVSTHTITPASALPWFSLEHNIAGSFETFNYTDAKINTLHFEADANGYAMGTVGFVARKETAGNTKTVSPTWDTSPMAIGTNITIQYNSVTLPAKSFSFDLNNNLEDDDFRLGSLYAGDVTEKRREITMGCTVRPADSALWKQATYGSGATTAPVGLTAKQPAVITITSYENIPSGTPTTQYSLAITVPSAAIRPFSVSPSGDDVIQHDMEIQALAPNPGTPILTAVLKNDLATVP